MDFAINLLLADAPGNELGGLGTEIEDEDFFTVNIHFLPVG